MRFVLAALTAVLLALPAQAQTVLYPDLEGEALLTAIRADYTPTQTLDYTPARDALYGYMDGADGEICAVYSGFCVTIPSGQTPRRYLFEEHGVNTEHTWPRSFGADGPREGDMHNLFPTRQQINSDRGNDPFGEIPDTQTTWWYRDTVERQSGIPTTDLDEWSEDTSSRFEPREDHKGNAARAVFYFYAIYSDAVGSSGDSFFATMRDDLIGWNEFDDPADDRERARSAFIATRQGTENPFVLDPTLARRAFAPETVDAEGGPGTVRVAVFPNPTAGRVVVEAPGAGRVEVVDTVGRRVLVSDQAAERRALDLGALPAGLYLVRVTTGAGTAVRPVVVAR